MNAPAVFDSVYTGNVVFWGVLIAALSWTVARIRLRSSGSPRGRTPIEDLDGGIVDVRALEAVLRSSARTRLVARLLGFFIVVAFWPGGGIIGLLAVIAIGFAVWLLVSRRAEDRQQRLDRAASVDGARRWLAVGLTILTYAFLGLFFAMLVFNALTAAESVASGETQSFSDIPNVAPEEQAQNTAMAAVMVVGLVGALVFNRAARRRRQLDRASATRRDTRPPILLLRAFGDDDMLIRASPGLRDDPLGRLGLSLVDRLEPVLAKTLSVYGPVTAVAQPGTRGLPLGAAREQIETSDWQTVVRGRIAEASWVVVVVGDISRASGLRDEVRILLECESTDKTVFVLPTCGGSEALERWSVMAAALDVDARLPRLGSTPVIRVHGRVAQRFLAEGPVRDTAYAAAISAAISAPHARLTD